MPHRVFEGNRPSNTILAGAPEPGDPRQARRALRAQRVRAGRDLAHRLRSISGASSWAKCSPAASRASWRARRARPQARQLDEHADPPLSQAPGLAAMARGYAKPLYVLPFDHRGSFQTKMFGWKGALDAEQTAEIAATKQVIYDGFKTALAGGVPKEQGRHPRRRAVRRRHPPRRRGERLHHGLPRREERPGRVRLRVRRRLRRPHRGVPAHLLQGAGALQPGGRRRAERAPDGPAQAALSDYLHGRAVGLFMFELLVPAEPAQLARVRRRQGRTTGSSARADGAGRSRSLQDAGVEPDVWKIEGLDRREDCVTGRRGRAPAAAATTWAASCWAAARTTRRSATG